MANLPADLPEDWTSNQKISPNGTEVGLSEQHGYNYLMKQVNDAQNEINNIGTTIEAALEDVAKEASVQEIITSIGETDDTGGSTVAGTVMAKLNEILEQLGISTSGSTVQEVLEELLNQPKIIKSIQKGTSTLRQEYSSITIATINPLKAFVILNYGHLGNSGTGVRLQQLTKNALIADVNASYWSWQVIEFV